MHFYSAPRLGSNKGETNSTALYYVYSVGMPSNEEKNSQWTLCVPPSSCWLRQTKNKFNYKLSQTVKHHFLSSYVAWFCNNSVLNSQQIQLCHSHDYARLSSFEHINNTAPYSSVSCDGIEIRRINLEWLCDAKKERIGYKVWDSHSSVANDSSLVGCYGDMT